MKKIFLIFIGLTSYSCASIPGDTFNSEVLISSKKEKIYINTLNWGLTDDNQITAISSNSNNVQKRSDTLNIVKGLEPFIYTFKDDKLTLYFDGDVSYKVAEKFTTIVLYYKSLNKVEYRFLQGKAYQNIDGYHSVPKRLKQNCPPDMPKPPNR